MGGLLGRSIFPLETVVPVPVPTPVLSVATFSALPGTAVEGQMAIVLDTSFEWQYSATWGWIRPQFYALKDYLVVDAELTGAVLPGAATPAWTETKSNGGDIVISAGAIKSYSTTVADNSTDWYSLAHTGDPTQDVFWMSGDFKLIGANNNAASSRFIAISTGARSVLLSLCLDVATGFASLVHSGSGLAVGYTLQDVDLQSDFVHVEMVIDPESVWVYFGREGMPALVASVGDFPATVTKLYGIGDSSGAARGDILAKNVEFGRFVFP